MVEYSQIFLDHMQQVKRCSPHTLTAYKADIGCFEVFLEKRFALRSAHLADAGMVRTWFADLSSIGAAKSTINRKVSSLRSFYGFLEKQNIIEKNPMLRIRSVKKPGNLPASVDESNLMRLFEEDSFMDDDFAGLRDRLLLELLYATGIRLSELIQLREQDVDPQAMRLRVYGKGNKERILPLLQHIVDLYSRYTAQKERKFGPGRESWFFLTDKGRQLYPVFVYRKVRHYLGMVTTRTKRSPHVLRHSFATHMLDHGADLNAIKELLGHANLSATQIYTHNTIDKIKHVYKQAHPKA
ncbi:MAG: integrase [Bacteroidia bacterium]|nr:MAG: integrase [Bacteroidia bacterium]